MSCIWFFMGLFVGVVPIFAFWIGVKGARTGAELKSVKARNDQPMCNHTYLKTGDEMMVNDTMKAKMKCSKCGVFSTQTIPNSEKSEADWYCDYLNQTYGYTDSRLVDWSSAREEASEYSKDQVSKYRLQNVGT